LGILEGLNKVWRRPRTIRGCRTAEERLMTRTYYRNATVSGRKIFYREAGDPSAPTILLLHGLPTSSQMFRDLMPALADRFHLIAPDYIASVIRTRRHAASSPTPSTIWPPMSQAWSMRWD